MSSSPDLLDRVALTDPYRCPACGARLAGPRCAGCGVDLSGPRGRELWQLSQQVAGLLRRRDGLLAELRGLARTGVPSPAAELATPATVAPPASPLQATPTPPTQATRASRPPRQSRRQVGVQALLVGLGAVLLAVAAVVFLVFSWERMSLGARSAVVAGASVAVLSAAGWLRPRLAETAEAVGALGVVLVLADAWAVRRLGVFGADRPEGLTYAASALAGCGAVLAGWAVLSRIRAGWLAACGLLPAALAMGGAAVAARTDEPLWTAPGLLLAAAACLGRRALPASLAAERQLLRAVAAAALALGVCGIALAGVLVYPATAAALLIAAATVAGCQVLAGRPEPLVGLWLFVAGGLAACAALPAAVRVVRSAELDLVWLLGLTPVLAVAVAAGLRRWLRETSTGAAAVAVVSALPAVVLAAAQVAGAAAVAVPAWRHAPATTLGEAWQLELLTAWLAVLLGLGALALLLHLHRETRGLAPWAAGLLAVHAALCPGLPLAAVVALLLILAGAAGAAGTAGAAAPAQAAGRARRAVLGTAALAGTLAVVLAWAVRPLSVPVTLLGVVGLLLARRLTPRRWLAAALAAAAASALLVAAGAVPALLERADADRLVAAGLLGAPLLALALCLPGRWSGVDRQAAALPGLLAFALALGAGAGRGGLQLVLGAGSLAAVVSALAARRSAGPVPPALAAGAAPPLLAALAVQLLPGVGAAVVGAWTLAAVGALLAALVLWLGLDGARRQAAEAGLALSAAGVLAITPDAGRLWVVLLGLGAGAAAIASTPGRHRVGWVSGVLLTASTWTRLQLADIGVVEAYTLPPAAALLAVGLLRLRSERGAATVGVPWRALLPAAGLGLAPSVLACAGGADLRPGLLLGAAAVLVIAGSRADQRLVPVLLAVGGAVAAGAGTVRPLDAVLDASSGPLQVERWSLPAALVVLAAALLALRAGMFGSRRELVAAAAAAPALLAGLPSLAAAAQGGPGSGWRAGAVLAVAAVLAVVLELGGRGHWQAPLGVGVAAAGLGLLLGAGPAPEAWTLPVGAVLLALGGHRLVREPAVGSWPALSAGLAVTLLPGLWLSPAAFSGTPRAVGFAVLAAGVLVAGAWLRLQAPLVMGAAALLMHALVQLAPWLSAAYEALPRWVVLAVLGGLLLGLGATYEQRLHQLRHARLRIGGLR